MRDEEWLLNAENLSIAGTRSNSSAAIRDFEEGGKRGGYRPPFQRDRERIIHCEAFRRLMHKTQVFPCPHLAEYRTRLTHTLEVAQIARSLSRNLGLNEDLTEAIALAHDLGHTPFGHMGEDILREILVHAYKDKQGFEHNEYNLEIVETMEDSDTINGRRPGMNLTVGTRQGILCHTRYSEKYYGGPKPVLSRWEKEWGYSSKEQLDKNPDLILKLTPEAQVVAISDEIAYLTHDLEDCRHAGILQITEAHPKLQEFMGAPRKDALHRLIEDIILKSSEAIGRAEASVGMPEIKIEYSSEIADLVNMLHDFFDNYIFKKEELARRNEEAKNYIRKLFDWWLRNPPENVQPIPTEIAKYIARQTDQQIIHEYQTIFTPQLI